MRRVVITYVIIVAIPFFAFEQMTIKVYKRINLLNDPEQISKKIS